MYSHPTWSRGDGLVQSFPGWQWDGTSLPSILIYCKLLLITGLPVDNCYEVFKLSLKPVKEKRILIHTAAVACNEVLKNSYLVIAPSPDIRPSILHSTPFLQSLAKIFKVLSELSLVRFGSAL